MSISKEKMVMQKEVVQAVVIADNFENDFTPVTNSTPFALLPLVNTPLIDYTLEFLSLGGIEETFLFCCSNFDVIKEHINNGITQFAGWSLTMKVNVIISESCRSLGDCLRDLDAKGLIRNDFVLVEPGTVGNIKLLPFIKKHSEICKNDKGAAMTVLTQEVEIGQRGRCAFEELLMVAANNRILFHKKLGTSQSRKVSLPLEILVDNPAVNIIHNLRDTHISICSTSVLPLFSDNFDFQTRDDFVRGLLMNEEILGSTVYYDVVKGNEYGAAVTNWRMYQAISYDIMHRWTYPLVPDIGICTQETDYVHMRNNIYRNKNTHLAKDSNLVEDVTIGYGSSVLDNSRVERTVIGNNVKIGRNVDIRDSFIMSDTTVEDDCIIAYSVIGPKCTIKRESTITNGCVLGKQVVIPIKTSIEDCLLQSSYCEGVVVKKLGDQAYKLKLVDNDTDFETEENSLACQVSRLHVDNKYVEESEDEGDDFSLSNEDESYRNSPVPDDTNLFLMEVMESLKRGFEDKLSCDNLILEINSSRYAYNVTVKEVNFHVVKAILTLPFQLFVGQRYLPSLQILLSYFSSILKNYIRNEAAMEDCLQAIEEIAMNNNELSECVSAVLHWFYEKDYLSEEGILKWFAGINSQTRLYAKVNPFATWLEQAEEESSENDT